MSFIIVISIAVIIFEYFLLTYKKAKPFEFEIHINKIIYILGIALILLSIYIAFVPWFYQSEPDFTEMLTGLSILSFLFFLTGNFCILLYQRSKIIIEKDGFIVQGIFKTQKVKWSNIREIKVNHFKKELIFITPNHVKCSLYFSNLNQLLILTEIKTKLDLTKIKKKI